MVDVNVMMGDTINDAWITCSANVPNKNNASDDHPMAMDAASKLK